jgi:hypothetical protein
MSALYAKCASCKHSSGCEVGSPFCRVWGTVLSASWSLIDICPHWAPHEVVESGGRQLESDAVANHPS